MCKLGDFGVSAVLKHAEENLQEGVGTPFYISPEMIKGKPYSYESDIWSLGIVLYEMTALKYPFQYAKNSDLFKAITKKEVDLNYLPFNYSKELKNIIKGCLKKDPTKRPTLDQLLEHSKVKLAIERMINKH